MNKLTLLTVSVSTLALLLTGCQAPGTQSYAERDRMTQRVGDYPPPPGGIQRARIGVPPFQVDERDGVVEGMNIVAADQATTLLLRTRRFNVIERAQLQQLVDEQELEGIVHWDEVAEMGQVRGVDYLLIGRVTNFRVTESQTGSRFGVGRQQLPFGGAIGAGGYEDRRSEINVECGIDLRLVDPSTGEIVAANFAEYNRTDSARSFDVQVLGVTTGSDARLQLNEGDQGRILRLAIDEAIYNMLDEIDDVLISRADSTQPID